MSSSHCNKTNFERKYTDLSYSAAERTRQCVTLHATSLKAEQKDQSETERD